MTSDPISDRRAELASAIDALKQGFGYREAAQRGEVQLLPIGQTQTLCNTCGGELAISVSSLTSEVRLYKVSVAHKRKDLIGHWWGTEERRDTRGQQWCRSIQKMVVNDFGTLVEVAE